MWHGTNLKEALAGIDYQKALRKPAAGSHNIYELVMHMYCWRRFVIEQLKGNTSYKVELNSEVDWPTHYEGTESSWKTAMETLENTQRELSTLLETFDDSKLDEMMNGRKFSWYIFFHGLIHHDIYHSGQIAILKK